MEMLREHAVLLFSGVSSFLPAPEIISRQCHAPGAINLPGTLTIRLADPERNIEGG